MPLLAGRNVKGMIELHKRSGSPVTMTSFIGDDARGFGRVVRNSEGMWLSHC
jgi:bifunctional N-acetylglucosamine-1-phosphate-uridyltransferase/glucosamine-1-phosphate-acetyltransferase GlmU-like protein